MTDDTTTTTELGTDALTEDELLAHEADGDTCNGWAFNYAAQCEDAVVLDMVMQNDEMHCAVHDRARDIVVDKTMRQFDFGPDLGAWDGSEHPYAADFEEVFEWEDEAAFEEHYRNEDVSPFIV